MNTRPHLIYGEFLLLLDMANGVGPASSTPASYLDRLLSLGYLRPLEGQYIVTRLGKKRIKQGA